MPNFADLSVMTNIAVFVVAAVVVWMAGTRLSRYADSISKKTGIGHVALGLLLLGGITSLPEAAVTISSSLSGNTALAVNNLLGGVAMQVAILAIADVAIGRDALTSVVPDPRTMVQGSLNIVLLAIVAAGIIVGDYAVLGAGLWSWLILAFYLVSLRQLSTERERRAWAATQSRSQPKGVAPSDSDGSEAADRSLKQVLTRTAVAGLAILIAGYLLSRTGEAIAVKTGLGSSFMGAVFIAISTSLPEVSTVLSAARSGLYAMAIADIFGTNLFDVALIWVNDIVSPSDPVLNQVGSFSVFAALLGIAVTALFVAGLAERRDQTVLRMGLDSMAVLVSYLAGLMILYSLR